MKPCDCKSMDDFYNMPEAGVRYNEYGFSIVPPNVIMRIPMITIKIPMYYIKRFAEWYLEDQEAE